MPSPDLAQKLKALFARLDVTLEEFALDGTEHPSADSDRAKKFGSFVRSDLRLCLVLEDADQVDGLIEFSLCSGDDFGDIAVGFSFDFAETGKFAISEEGSWPDHEAMFSNLRNKFQDEGECDSEKALEFASAVIEYFISLPVERVYG